MGDGDMCKKFYQIKVIDGYYKGKPQFLKVSKLCLCQMERLKPRLLQCICSPRPRGDWDDWHCKGADACHKWYKPLYNSVSGLCHWTPCTRCYKVCTTCKNHIHKDIFKGHSRTCTSSPERVRFDSDSESEIAVTPTLEYGDYDAILKEQSQWLEKHSQLESRLSEVVTNKFFGGTDNATEPNIS